MTDKAFCRSVIIAAMLLGVAHAGPAVDFVKDVQPIFEKSCLGCHGSALQMGGLRLDAKNFALAGGQSGKVIQPGNASGSMLYRRIAGTGGQARMPIGAKPLEPAQIELIRSWIEHG